MEPIRRMTMEVRASLDDVWAALADADGWVVDPAARATVSVVAARAPDRVTWHVTGRAVGTVEWELNDLDELTFAFGEWQVAPTRPRPGRSSRRARRDHDRRASSTAQHLSARLGLEVVAQRGDARHPRREIGRAPRGAGALLLGAMWLSAPPRHH